MSEKKNNKENEEPVSNVNRQGLSENVADQQPKSQLEQRTKKKNTKI